MLSRRLTKSVTDMDGYQERVTRESVRSVFLDDDDDDDETLLVFLQNLLFIQIHNIIIQSSKYSPKLPKSFFRE